MDIVVVTPPPVEPVTIAEVYEFLRWDADEEGSPPELVYPLAATISRNIVSAREFVEQATRRALVKQTLRMTIPGRGLLASECWWRGPEGRGVELLRPPVAQVESVQYYDALNVLQTVDIDDYYMTDGYVPSLVFVDSWLPSSLARRQDALRVTYVAGYPWNESPEDYTSQIPSALKDAICLHVQLLADRFDANEKADVERTRDALLSSFRVHNF